MTLKMRFMMTAVLSVVASLAFAEPSPNLSVYKQTLMQYHDNGQYLNDIKKVDEQAENYLQQQVDQNAHCAQPKKLAIVLDIDETSLSNYPEMVKLNFGGTVDMFNQAVAQADDPAIAPTLDLYRLAEKDHVAVFFVTGRPAVLTDATVKNLQAEGYTTWNALYLKPANYKQHSVVPYKSSVRKQIEAQGYDIVVNVGDQYSDLQGGYADQVFKLPNPYYYIP